MKKKQIKSDPYEKLRRAWKSKTKRDVRLTYWDVLTLMDDTAIRDAVLRTYEGEE